jgi:anti-sigma-K factor RskA
MKLEALKRTLLAAARAHAPSDRVPYAFEKRIMARLTALPAPDALTLWAQALWRSAAAVTALAALVTIGSLFVESQTTAAISASSGEELSLQFENTLLASVEQSTPGYEDVP